MNSYVLHYTDKMIGHGDEPVHEPLYRSHLFTAESDDDAMTKAEGEWHKIKSDRLAGIVRFISLTTEPIAPIQLSWKPKK